MSFALVILAVVIAVLCAFHTSDEPSPIAIKAAAPACVFEKHPIKPLEEVGMKIRLFRSKPLLRRPLWYFRITAGNGEIVAQSEGYSRRIDAKTTAEHLRDNLGSAGEVVDA